MRLNKSHKDAFVASVINDIPQIDYKEQARKLVYEDSIAQLPASVQVMARDPNMACYLHTYYHYFGAGYGANFGSMAIFHPRGVDFTLSSECTAKLTEMAVLAKAQSKNLSEAGERVRGAIEACTTVKMALERMPEFEKYLPKTGEKSTHLPAIANVVADLVKLGWPKDKTEPVKAAQAEEPAKVITL